MKKLGLLGLCAIALVWISSARADIVADECEDLEEGDPCTTLLDEEGVCDDDDGELVCTAEEEEEDAGAGDDDDDDDETTAGGGGCNVAKVDHSSIFVSLFALSVLALPRRKRNDR